MRILFLVGFICLITMPAFAGSTWNHEFPQLLATPANICDIVANDMAIVYIELIREIHIGEFAKDRTGNLSIIFQSLVDSYKLADCDSALWRGKLFQLQQKLDSND